MLGRLLIITLPALTIIVLVRYKLPHDAKIMGLTPREWVFERCLGSKLGTLVTATLWSWLVVKHIMSGTMAGPAILLCDLLLYTALAYFARRWKQGAYREPEPGLRAAFLSMRQHHARTECV